jgi:hypothetical protein
VISTGLGRFALPRWLCDSQAKRARGSFFVVAGLNCKRLPAFDIAKNTLRVLLSRFLHFVLRSQTMDL